MDNETENASASQTLMQQQVQLMQQMIELQRENNELRRNVHSSGSSSTNARKPDRPTIEPDSSDSDWALFVDSWERYKNMCKLREVSDIRNELRSCCSSEINKLLFDLIGSERLNTTTESDLMAHIKSVAVKGMHIEVHRQTFHAMKQSEGESITHFLARLRAQANFCNFIVQCSNATICTQKVSYAEDMISGQMIAGLVNTEHQGKVLAQVATLTTLQQKFDLLVSLETTDQSRSKLKVPPTTPAPPSDSSFQKSDYKRSKNPPKNQDEIRPCTGCGKKSHPGKSLKRKDCPAFNINCRKCGIKGHFEDVCKKSMEANTDTQSPPTVPSASSAQISGTSTMFSQVTDASGKNTAKNRRRRRYRAIRKQKQRDVIDKEKQLDFVRHIRRNNNRHGRNSKSCPVQSVVIPHME